MIRLWSSWIEYDWRVVESLYSKWLICDREGYWGANAIHTFLTGSKGTKTKKLAHVRKSAVFGCGILNKSLLTKLFLANIKSQTYLKVSLLKLSCKTPLRVMERTSKIIGKYLGRADRVTVPTLHPSILEKKLK